MEKDKNSLLNKEDSKLVEENIQKSMPSKHRENIPSQKNIEFLNGNTMETQKYCFPARPISSSYKNTRPEFRTNKIINCI